MSLALSPPVGTSSLTDASQYILGAAGFLGLGLPEAESETRCIGEDSVREVPLPLGAKHPMCLLVGVCLDSD